jgi:UDP:flavonoid glycosyltransferase YjiC (YdhE family)
MGRRRPLRILFAFVGGWGHLEPLLPIARAAREAGHVVAFCCARSMAGSVEAAGFDVVTSPEPPAPPQTHPGPSAPGPLLPVDRAREERDLREKFAREGARRQAARLLSVASRWRPDLVVTDEADFGTVIGAERLGIPCATVVVLLAGGMLRPDVVATALDEVRAEHGLPPDPELRRMRGDLVVDPAPPGFRYPTDPLPSPAIRIRLDDPMSSSGAPPWTPVRPGAAALYVTLGTVFNLESGDLLDRVLAAVREVRGDVLVTVGHELDPASFATPAHVHVERFVPQSLVLPHVDAVVCHGGSGTVLAAIGHGLPLVLLPMGADQPWNGDRCSALGLGRVLDPVMATSADIRGAIDDVVTRPTYRRRAERMRDGLMELPGPAAAFVAIERLATGRS